MSISLSFFLTGWVISFLVPSVGLATSPDTSRDISQKTQSRLFNTNVVVVFPNPNFWETQHRGEFQNRGVAQIDKLGTEFVLTVSCKGIHRVFIHQNPKIHLEDFLGQFVQARYTYGDIKKQVQCIKKPCNLITERKLLIHDLEVVLGSEEIRAQFETKCEP